MLLTLSVSFVYVATGKFKRTYVAHYISTGQHWFRRSLATDILLTLGLPTSKQFLIIL